MRFFVAAVQLSAAGAVALVATQLPGSGSGLALLVFAAMAVAAEVKGEQVYGASTVSLSAIPVVAAAWLVLTLTHSPIAVGVLMLCQFLPATALGLVGGVMRMGTGRRALSQKRALCPSKTS